MRVLHVGLSKKMGGVERFALNYFEYLRNKGVIFDFLDIYGEGIVNENKIAEYGGTIYTVPKFTKHPIQAYRKIKRILEKRHYDCIHINMLSAANLIPVFAVQCAGYIPLVHSHNTRTSNHIVRKVAHKMNVGILRRLEVRRFACGKEAGEWLWGDKLFEVIPNAINRSMYEFSLDSRINIRTEKKISPQAVVLGFVGRLEEQKNPIFLLEIFEKLLKKQDRKKEYKLVVIGDGSLRAEMVRQCKLKKIDKDVIFVGQQNEVNEWFSAMDIFLLPSLYEGLPVVGVEAQASGMMCLFADTITKEIEISDNVTFLDIEHGGDIWVEKIEEMKDKILVRDGTERLFESDYMIEKAGAKLLKIYQKYRK